MSRARRGVLIIALAGRGVERRASQRQLARLVQWRCGASCARRQLRSADDDLWQPTTLVQCVSTRPWLVYPGCDEPGGCHDLTLGKIYEMLGVEGQGSFYRIIDDSGEDYLYPIRTSKWCSNPGLEDLLQASENASPIAVGLIRARIR